MQAWPEPLQGEASSELEGLADSEERDLAWCGARRGAEGELQLVENNTLELTDNAAITLDRSSLRLNSQN
ncbi:hypothetical protein HaLaN_28572, partial [Haematococcus lacustris]